MRKLRTTLTLALLATTGLVMMAANPDLAQDQDNLPAELVPLVYCDRLPVLIVAVNDKDRRFLVDTAATSMLNIKSFRGGRSSRLNVSSWSGTEGARARVFKLDELRLGKRRLKKLSLPGIDLTRIEQACGGTIDGILGVDLLERLGVTLDLRRKLAIVPSAPENAALRALREGHQIHSEACLAATISGDVEVLGSCLAEDIVLHGIGGEFRGREAVLTYLKQTYFDSVEPGHVEIRDTLLELMPDVAWYGFQYSAVRDGKPLKARGLGVCRKGPDGWRIVLLHTTLMNETADGSSP